MSALKEKLAEAMDAFARLSEREKVIILGAGTVLATLLILTLTLLTLRGIDRASRQVTSKSEQLREILSMRDAYKQAEDQNAALRSRLARNDLRLVALVEDEAKRLGIELGNINPSDGEADPSGVKTSRVELRAQKLSYDKVTSLLERLEGQASPVKVVRLRLHQRFDEKDLVDLEMTVATYKAS